MARSVGFKMNYHLARFFESNGLTADMAEKIFTVRAICAKFQEMEDIQHDLAEMTAQAEHEAAHTQTDEAEAA